jgi:hypothetical protein
MIKIHIHKLKWLPNLDSHFFEIGKEMLLFMLKSFIIILIPSGKSLPRNLEIWF